jgi:ferric-dicitrate binding protein FerR (iron transport regulator)
MTTGKRDVNLLLADESFQRWLRGEASLAEEAQWHEWLIADARHHTLLAEARDLWQAGQFRPAVPLEVEFEWQKLQQRLHRSAAKTASVRSLPKREAFASRWRYGIMAAAAVLALALLGRYLLAPRQPVWQAVSTVNGERSHLQLPDGSRIILNANSTLRYPADWVNDAARRVELRGEAYFEVTPQAGWQRDFIVQTSDGAVQVVGTRFAVYERGEGTRVAVEEGKVAVTSALSAARVSLEPGQLTLFHKNDHTLTPNAAPLGFHTTWWQDHIKLEGTPFGDVARRLEETYGIRVQVRDESLRQRKLSGAIENRDLDVLITALAKALGAPVQREGDTVILGSR